MRRNRCSMICYAEQDTVENPNAVAIAERCRGLLLTPLAERSSLRLPRCRPHWPSTRDGRLGREIGPYAAGVGALQRRAKRKTAAKKTLEQALAMFEAMGAEMWVARTRDELGRIGLRRPVVSDGLTPAQATRRRAGCFGNENREVASTLYMSLRSVESHLTKVYRELGVKSRAQLAATLTAKADPIDGDQPPTETA